MIVKSHYEMIAFHFRDRNCWHLADHIRKDLELKPLPSYDEVGHVYTRKSIPRDFALKAMEAHPRARVADGGAEDGDIALMPGLYGRALFTHAEGEWLGFGPDGYSHWHDHDLVAKNAHSFWRIDR